MLSVPIATGNNAVDLGGISIVQQSTKLAAHAPESSTSFALNAGDFANRSAFFSGMALPGPLKFSLLAIVVLCFAFLLAVVASLLSTVLTPQVLTVRSAKPHRRQHQIGDLALETVTSPTHSCTSHPSLAAGEFGPPRKGVFPPFSPPNSS